MERKLAAILAADVVGTSRLMEANEAGTLVATKVRWRNTLPRLLPSTMAASSRWTVMAFWWSTPAIGR
jgi:hypothetical protein